MELTADIQDQIKKHLPGMVGDELQAFIKKAKEDASSLAYYRGLVEKAEAENSRLKKLELNETAICSRELAVCEKEREVKFKEEMLKLREEHAKERVTEIRSLVQNVFSSNRMDYNLSLGGSLPIMGPGMTYPQNHNFNVGGVVSKPPNQ